MQQAMQSISRAFIYVLIYSGRLYTPWPLCEGLLLLQLQRVRSTPVGSKEPGPDPMPIYQSHIHTATSDEITGHRRSLQGAEERPSAKKSADGRAEDS